MQNNEEIISKYVIYSKTDLKGIITEVSDAFCTISGYSQEELIGQSHNIVRSPDMSSSIFKDMWDTIQSGNIWSGEVKNQKKDGGYYWVIADITPQKDLDGNIISYMAIRHDITVKKDFIEQQRQLLQSEKMASLGEMIINIAHQWRQPLSLVSTLVTSMQMQKEFGILSDDKFDESCTMINDNIQNLSKIINDFQNYIKDDRNIELVGINSIVKNFLNLAESSINNHNINIIIGIDEKIKINCIKNQVIECFINIFNNSKDVLVVLPKKERYFFIDIKQSNNNIIIKFKDNGGGISSDIISKIFEPYFTTKHQSFGTGLGLHTVYNTIVNILNGTIEVHNIEYSYNNKMFKGAQFIITIPLS